MIFYFTGSGNSMWTAKTLGTALEQPVTNIVAVMGEEQITVPDEVVGLVFPTYMNDIPWLVKAFLLRLHLRAACYCFAVMTSNNGKSGKAFDNIDRALHTNGAKLSAGFDLQMPGNCIESSDEANVARLQEAPAKVCVIAEQLRKRTVNYMSGGKSIGENFVESSFFYGTHSLRPEFALLRNRKQYTHPDIKLAELLRDEQR